MLKRLLDTVRQSPLLKLLLFFHGLIVAVLVALYYMRADAMLWGSILSVPVTRNADGNWLYQRIAGGPFVMLPWNLLPQHVLWLGLDVLIAGSLTIWWTCRMAENELRLQLAGREKAVADKLQEAEEQSAAVDHRMREAGAWERRLKARESRVVARESEAANRELQAQARVEEKDAEVRKMSTALTRLKTEVSDLRKRLRA